MALAVASATVRQGSRRGCRARRLPSTSNDGAWTLDPRTLRLQPSSRIAIDRRCRCQGTQANICREIPSPAARRSQPIGDPRSGRDLLRVGDDGVLSARSCRHPTAFVHGRGRSGRRQSCCGEAQSERLMQRRAFCTRCRCVESCVVCRSCAVGLFVPRLLGTATQVHQGQWLALFAKVICGCIPAGCHRLSCRFLTVAADDAET